jgi:hypothetical protein
MTFAKICAAIHSGELDADLSDLMTVVGDRKKAIGRNLKNTLRVGQVCRMVNCGKASGEECTVVKVNRTRAVIDTQGGRFTIPFQCLELI